MRKIILGAALLGSQLFCAPVFAQDEPAPKKSNHYIGIQANQLIRQIFNFGGNNNVASNPYSITYAVNAIEGGVGFNFGFGYTYSQTTDGDPALDRTTTVNDLFLRFGLERKKEIAPRLIVSFGGDLVADLQKTDTKTEDNSQSQISFESGRKSNGFGLGPRLTLNYALTDKILIGTEANWYFKSFSIKNFQRDVFFETIFDPATGQPRQVRRTNEQKTDEKQKRFQFNAPAVIFIILKF